MFKNIDFTKTEITGGFWKKKQDMVRKTTVHAVYDRFAETGRFAAAKCNWKEGEPNRPHIFWDSDIAKWMEGAAYLISLKRDKKLEKLIDETVDDFAAHQWEDGYLGTYYTMFPEEGRFTKRGNHELYCVGHLIEAAVAYYEATGKRKLLEVVCRAADCIEKHFKTEPDAAFRTPGHEEIELALVKLYRCTGEKRYLDLAAHFINTRGTCDEAGVSTSAPSQKYLQSHLPVREQTEAVGHAVRAVYLYCGMADLAYETGDKELLGACKTLFDNIITKRMYITGGIGSSAHGEAFTLDYDLSNLMAYTETCAAIGLAFFASRMQILDMDSKYADTIERVLYNGFLSSTSLDGKAFFYENPLEIIPYLHQRDSKESGSRMHWPAMHRLEVFGCSCCPPNVVRFIPSIANYLYTDDGETLYLHQYMQSRTEIERGGKKLTVEQATRFPENGKLKVTVKGGDLRLAVRIPEWCDTYEGETVKGYAFFDLKDGESLDLDFGMKVRFVEARREAVFNCGRYAVMRGPVVYCMESLDNCSSLRDVCLDGRARFIQGKHEELGVPTLKVKAFRRPDDGDAPLYRNRQNKFETMTATLIPYYAFANRDICEMQVWHRVK